MNEPIVYKRSVLIGQLALVQILAPPLVAIGMLFGCRTIWQRNSTTSFASWRYWSRSWRPIFSGRALHPDDPARAGLDCGQPDPAVDGVARPCYSPLAI